jgi:preprotein translocase subunit SecG
VIPVLIAINIIAGLFLIGVVLLQSGKGADMGAAFGGANSTMFGPSGAGDALTKATAGFATLFMLTSLALAVMSADSGSVFDNVDLPAAAAPTAAPAPTAAVPPPSPPTGAFDPEAAAEASAAAAAAAGDEATGTGGDATGQAAAGSDVVEQAATDAPEAVEKAADPVDEKPSEQ